jgi:benzoyl-CoA 2,3-epoxidase subunit B
MDVFENGAVVHKDIAMRNALNEVLRTEYSKDCLRGVERWNKTIREEGVDFEFKLPSSKFHRQIGMWAGHYFSPEGTMITQADEDYVKSLMKPVVEPGKMASWIAAPLKGINNLPGEFEYVRM